MDDTAIDPRRLLPISIEWVVDNLIGRITIAGEFWGAVEWSESRQMWCIEDAEGACLRHASSIHGKMAGKDEAVALAEAMVRDGRLPNPERAKELRAEADAVGKVRRAKRRQQPAEIRKRAERAQEERRIGELGTVAWRAREAEKAEAPLYEMLADVFDFSDAELWKSNSFAALRPRLIVHVQHVVAELEYELAGTVRDGHTQPFQMGASKEQRARARTQRQQSAARAVSQITAKLDRAREILEQLEAAG